ncbi:hypothetical protein ES705_36034 [subsurface metagenome]
MRKFLIVLVIATMATFLFVGCDGVTPPIENNPPEIISSAITSGKVGVVYNYGVNATDPEGDTLIYYLTEKPLGMSIVPTTGIIKWIPTDAGLFAVGVKVSDPDGLFDVQGFNITVAKADEPEPEPVPDPVIELTGIVVDPKTMTLFAGKSEAIESVTATYDIRGTEVNIALGDCTYKSDNEGIAIVSDTGLVEAVAEGVTIVTVSYKGKSDTLAVTVKAVEPEPELALVGIAVDPKTMDLIVGGTEDIVSVTATYEMRGYEVDIDLGECLFLTSNSKVATVSHDGMVTAEGVGTADIVVNYKGESDTLEVTVVAYTPMELIEDMPVFEVDVDNLVGIPALFTVEVVANDDKGKSVKSYFKMPEGFVEVEENETPADGDYTVLIYAHWLPQPEYVDLKDYEFEGEVVLGSGTVNDPLIDETLFFIGTFSEVGNYETTVEVWTITDEEKDVLLCSKVITAKVIPVIPEN